MELIAILIAGAVGWQNGSLGPRDLKMIVLVVLGWTAVTTAASVPYLTLAEFVLDLVIHTALVAVPYLLGALARRLAERRR